MVIIATAITQQGEAGKIEQKLELLQSKTDADSLFLCSSYCYKIFLGDGTCDQACNNAKCNYDKGDCQVTTS